MICLKYYHICSSWILYIDYKFYVFQISLPLNFDGKIKYKNGSAFVSTTACHPCRLVTDGVVELVKGNDYWHSTWCYAMDSLVTTPLIWGIYEECRGLPKWNGCNGLNSAEISDVYEDLRRYPMISDNFSDVVRTYKLVFQEVLCCIQMDVLR